MRLIESTLLGILAIGVGIGMWFTTPTPRGMTDREYWIRKHYREGDKG